MTSDPVREELDAILHTVLVSDQGYLETLSRATGLNGKALTEKAAFTLSRLIAAGGYVLNNFAALLQDMLRFEEAEALYRQALEITSKTLGESHSVYATRLNNLAELLGTTERYEEAEPLYRQALEITQKTLGKEHPDYATRLNNFAGLLDSTERYDEAEPLYRLALEICEKALGTEHPRTQTVRQNLELFLSEKPT